MDSLTAPPNTPNQLTADEAAAAREEIRRVIHEIERVIVGKRSALELVMAAFLARGHVLIEDIPGVGKTTLAKALAHVIGGVFKRIQFTPDLLPGDVTGLTIYNQRASEWSFTPGPVFANVLLADEINRATPKTQSALLEAMEESQVTVDGVTHALPQPFFVLATQNPVEYRGTYPLPEAQMDRFLIRLRLGYPGPDEEVQMLARHAEADSGNTQAAISSNGASSATREDSTPPDGVGNLLNRVQTVLTPERARVLQQFRARVYVSQALREYIVGLVAATREHPQIALGASPRASLALQRVAQGSALLQGREWVEPDDIKALAPSVLGHRIILQGGSNLSNSSGETLITQLLEEVAVP